MKRVRIGLVSVVLFVLGCQSAVSPFVRDGQLRGVELGSQGAWSVVDGVVACSGDKDGYAWLSTDRVYGDFELTLEWRIEPEGNTGIFCRAPDRKGRTSMKGFEIQARDDVHDTTLDDVSGAVFSRIPAAGKFSKPVGQWNRFKVTCRGRQLRIELNGHLVSDTDMDTIESMRSVPNEGYMGLQNHGTPAAFRNIQIRELD